MRFKLPLTDKLPEPELKLEVGGRYLTREGKEELLKGKTETNLFYGRAGHFYFSDGTCVTGKRYDIIATAPDEVEIDEEGALAVHTALILERIDLAKKITAEETHWLIKTYLSAIDKKKQPKPESEVCDIEEMWCLWHGVGKEGDGIGRGGNYYLTLEDARQSAQGFGNVYAITKGGQTKIQKGEGL